MIDIENELYTELDEKLDCNVSKEYSPFAENLPLVTFMCIDNSIAEQYRDSRRIENMVNLTFEVNAYSASDKGKLQEAKNLISEVDDILSERGLARTFCRQTPNIDNNVVRVTAQYQCRCDGKFIYRR